MARDLEVPEERAPNLTPPPGNPRFPLFDALRAIAALSVFAGHSIEGVYGLSHLALFVWAFAFAYGGVAIFFLISGFLLYRPFLVARRAGRPMGLSQYAKRRFLRIVPAYWAALTILLATGFVSVSSGHWWVFYGFGQIYSINTLGGGIAVAWTLCIEVTFYAILPLFSWVAGRLGSGPRSIRADAVLLVVLSAASLAFRAHYSAPAQFEKVSTLPGTFFWFALGMGLAIASVALEGRSPVARLGHTLAALWPLVSWLTAGLLFVLIHEISLRTIYLGLPVRAVAVHALYGLVGFFLLLPAVFGEHRGGVVRAVLRARVLTWIGLISYAFYLYHAIVIIQLKDVLQDAGISPLFPALAAASLIVSLVCAAVSYYLLERPMMLLGRSLRSRPRLAMGWGRRIRR